MRDETLIRGLELLCQSDRDTARILSPRLAETASLLEKYIAEIELFNRTLSLVGAKDRRELVVKHILDSLAPLGIITRLLAGQAAERDAADDPPAIADVGSGAGLPGIPLAICLPNARFTLIERMGRRAGFLRNTQAVLALANVETEEREMENVSARFDLAVFRAFRPLEPAIARSLLRLLKPGGALAAYKGRRETAEAELAALAAAPAAVGQTIRAEILPCPVPFLEEERHIVIIRGRLE
jgi:16S rRNA (guanine527-N7)-methyltransferase